MKGLPLSARMMIEGCVQSDKGIEIRISIYNPHDGEYSLYAVPSQSGSVSDLWAKILGETSQEKSPSNPYRIERKYKANYTSLRSGAVGSTRRSKIFKR